MPIGLEPGNPQTHYSPSFKIVSRALPKASSRFD
jgi:hypothetical protein